MEKAPNELLLKDEQEFSWWIKKATLFQGEGAISVNAQTREPRRCVLKTRSNLDLLESVGAGTGGRGRGEVGPENEESGILPEGNRVTEGLFSERCGLFGTALEDPSVGIMPRGGEPSEEANGVVWMRRGGTGLLTLVVGMQGEESERWSPEPWKSR